MITAEYINLVHSYPCPFCFYCDLPKFFNGEWTIDGKEWYPCVILDDDVGDGKVKIVTRNQTHMTKSAVSVRRYKKENLNNS